MPISNESKAKLIGDFEKVARVAIAGADPRSEENFKGALGQSYKNWVADKISTFKIQGIPEADYDSRLKAEQDEWVTSVTKTYAGGVEAQANRGLNIDPQQSMGIMSSALSGNFQGAFMQILMQLDSVREYVQAAVGFVGNKINAMINKNAVSMSFGEILQNIRESGPRNAGLQALANRGDLDSTSAADLAAVLKNPPIAIAQKDEAKGEKPASTLSEEKKQKAIAAGSGATMPGTTPEHVDQNTPKVSSVQRQIIAVGAPQYPDIF